MRRLIALRFCFHFRLCRQNRWLRCCGSQRSRASMRDQRRSLQQSDGPLPIPPPSILVVRASILLFFADLGPPCATSGGRCDRVIGPCQCRSPPPWSCVRVPASFFSGDTSCRRLADHQQGSRAVAWHKSLGTSARWCNLDFGCFPVFSWAFSAISWSVMCVFLHRHCVLRKLV